MEEQEFISLVLLPGWFYLLSYLINIFFSWLCFCLLINEKFKFDLLMLIFVCMYVDRWSEHIPMSPMEGCPSVFQVICSLMPGYHQVVSVAFYEFRKHSMK